MTLQLLFPMGGLGTRFSQVGISTPKPLIIVDEGPGGVGGTPMILKALSGFEDMIVEYEEFASGSRARGSFPCDDVFSPTSDGHVLHHVRFIFVIRTEHETEHHLRTRIQQVLEDKYGCDCYGYCLEEREYRGWHNGGDVPVAKQLPIVSETLRQVRAVGQQPGGGEGSSPNPLSRYGISITAHFVMMWENTRGAAETCLLAQPALLPEHPLIICDCDLYVRSRYYYYLIVCMMRRVQLLARHPPGDMPPWLRHLRGGLVFFNSTAPRYSYAAVESIANFIANPFDDGREKRFPGGRVTKTAEKVVISNNALIGAYAFAAAQYFIISARRLVEAGVLASQASQDNSCQAPRPAEFYISLLYNQLLCDEFPADAVSPSEAAEKAAYVVAVPREAYDTFGTPEELAAYKAGKCSFAKE